MQSTKEQVKEYLDKYDFVNSESGIMPFDTEVGDLFNTKIVHNESEYHKHKSVFEYNVHNVEGTSIYFQTTYLVDYDHGSEFEDWCFVEPVVKTITTYEMVR